jgi:hypothetical protein
LKDPDKYGLMGKETVKKCDVNFAFEQIKDVFVEAMKDYGR